MQINNEYGTLAISNDVIAVVASDTASSCFGVKGLADKSAIDGLVRLLKRETRKKGVKVRTLEDNKVALEIRIIMLNGVNIKEACRSILKEVKYNVEKRTGVSVGSIEILVEGIKA